MRFFIYTALHLYKKKMAKYVINYIKHHKNYIRAPH
jgi:uncharacterized protein YpiB (UPF0302 family)